MASDAGSRPDGHAIVSLRQTPYRGLVVAGRGGQAAREHAELDAFADDSRHEAALRAEADGEAVGPPALGPRLVPARRLAAAGYIWAFASLRSPGARSHYDHRRAQRDRHTSARRNTFNRMLGCLHKGTPYNEEAAFRSREAIAA
ncbi:hypothetical protein [Nonomuraea sp. NPDC050310]|uniref:hypothetical protein n=1 Tax=Nonomuraea sp. NPDC050310 TaxID=3154935 RepID=UPI00340839E4